MAALDEDEAMAMEVDDDEVPTQGKRKRNTHNKELYDQFLTMNKRMDYNMSGKRYVRNDKMPLDRFMELANITCTNLDDHDIVFPELYEIYS
jgi:hypothetical protein